jgi:antitoxin VapB
MSEPRSAVDPLKERRAEIEEKLRRIRSFLEGRGLEAALLTKPGSFSWVTAGAENPIIRGSEGGALCSVLVTRSEALVMTQNIEGPRLAAEEGLPEFGFQIIEHPWYRGDLWPRTIERFVAREKVGSDAPGAGTDITADVIRLRLPLVPIEVERLRLLCADAARALEEALRAAVRNERERDIAARVVDACERRGIVLPVLLVGSGDRMRRFRHCPPSDTRVERDAMAVIVGVRHGLNVACTRMISFGDIDPELDQRQAAACQVEAAMIAATVPSGTFGGALQAGIDAYRKAGWPGEHEYHYQGGPIGYDVREFGPAPEAQPDAWTKESIPDGSACAWNPTVRGGKSEDTFLVTWNGPEILTVSSWPQRSIELEGLAINRPAILTL